MLKARPEVVAAVRTGAPLGDAKIDALVTFTRAVVRNKGFVPETAVAAFLAAGYSKAQLLEVVGHVGLTVLANYTQALTGAPIGEEFLPPTREVHEIAVASRAPAGA